MYRGRGEHNALNSEIMFIRELYGPEYAPIRESDILRQVRGQAFISDDTKITLLKHRGVPDGCEDPAGGGANAEAEARRLGEREGVRGGESLR